MSKDAANLSSASIAWLAHRSARYHCLLEKHTPQLRLSHTFVACDQPVP